MPNLQSFAEALTFKFSSHRKHLKSPVPSLLHSNNPPSDEELALIHRAIARTQARVKAIGTRDDYPSNLYTHFLQSHTNLLSVSRRLPTELLVEIFLHVVEEPTDPVHNSPPWILGHICRRWRSIALSTPKLWVALPPLYLGTTKNPQLKLKMDSLTALLARSSGNKLSFYLSKQRGAPCADDVILSLLLEHSNRWERISFDISERSWAHFSSVKCRLASLRSLKLNITRATGYVHGDVDAFKIAPALQEVYLSASTSNEVIGLPRSQLTSFAEETMDFRHYALALSTAPCIKKLSLIFDPFVEDLIDIPPITRSSLKTLIIQSFSPQTAPNPALNKLTLPALQELVFRYFCPNNYIKDLVPLIVRSGCTLRKLVLNSPGISKQDIINIVTLTPSLTDLDINDPGPEFLEFLRLVESGPLIRWLVVPSLQSLTIHLNRSDYRIFAPLIRLAEGRCDFMPDPNLPLDDIPETPYLLKTFKISPQPINSGAYAYDDFASHFGLRTVDSQLATETADSTAAASVILIQKHLHRIESANNDMSLMRKGRFELVLRRVEELVSFLEQTKMTMTPDSIVHLYFTKVADPLRQILMTVQIPINRKISFARRLDALLSEWSSILEQVSPKQQWGWNADGDLLYIPTNNGEKLPLTLVM
ncbi:hypothetical protein CVT25_013493 [Psilocybe cyanescens]|uniref:Uncharacterized protein n=1 Tax=Psilocybe cyanescens TaxID=93625 RepID=A0A409XSV3_PSICY|nr:hypothetical protein CVT25_013493 [Psilocybe cyanescens]